MVSNEEKWLSKFLKTNLDRRLKEDSVDMLQYKTGPKLADPAYL